MKITTQLPREEERMRIDCLNGALIYPERRSGNTTRLIDNAIQHIMDGYVCKVLDHHPSLDMQRYIFDRILMRIKIEHQQVYEKYLMVNTVKFYIWLDGPINQQRK